MHWHWHIHAQNVFIIGATGGVGGRLIEQIYTSDSWNSNHLHPTRILGIANSTHILLADPGTSLEWLSWSHAEDIRADLSLKGTPIRDWYQDILASLEILGIEESDIVFIDTTADHSEENLAFHMEVIRRGGSIVTANKNPIALCDSEQFDFLTSDRRRYGYRASVMAWGPAISEIIGAYDTKNTIHSIKGCFSGTLAYICSELEKWLPFSSIVVDAHTRRYTEPNPWDDLSGYDVAKKILILARTAGYDVSMNDAIIEPFISREFADLHGHDFFHAIQTLDRDFSSRMTRLQAEDRTLRYVATFRVIDSKPEIRVWPQEVSREDPLGSLRWTNNKIVVETDCFTTDFSRPWAWLDNTANSIRVDLAWLLQERIA